MKDDQRSVLQDQLVDVIMRIMVKHKDLHYYQVKHSTPVELIIFYYPSNPNKRTAFQRKPIGATNYQFALTLRSSGHLFKGGSMRIELLSARAELTFFCPQGHRSDA